MPSDSFADLWNSSTPSTRSAKPQTLASQSTASLSNGGSRPGSRLDAFSLLAATSTSTSGPSSRSITPSLSSSSSNTVKKAPSSQGGSSDAFSSLLGSTFASASSRKDAASLSLADRQARSLQEQRSQSTSNPKGGGGSGGVWDGLDMLGNAGPTSSSSSSSLQRARNDEDDWAFDFGSAKAKAATPAQSKIDEPRPTKASDADLFDLLLDSAPAVKKPSPSPPAPARNESLTFDPFEHFTSPQEGRGREENQALNDPDDFDFGDREYREEDEGDDEILGILGSRSRGAAESLREEIPQEISPRHSPLPRSKSTASPPPHILGQIVEMGFSPQQARLALAATDTGLDVQQAFEMLLSNGAGASSHSPSSPIPSSEPPEPRQQRRTRPNPSRHDSANSNTTASQQQQQQTPTSGDLQEKADKLLAQASEIGLSVFSRAGALWKEGKARAQKVYEEQIVASASGSTSVVGSGRSTPNAAGRRGGEQQQQERGAGGGGKPKWMTGDGEFKDDEEHHSNAGHTGGFRDDDDDGGAPSEPPVLPRRQQAPPPRAKEPVNLFGDDEPTTYVSPARRRGGRSNDAPPTSTAQAPPSRQPKPRSHPQPSQQQPRQPRPPTPPSIRLRPPIPASPAAFSSSSTHKAQGTAFFKLGRYAEAVTSYTSALSSLPEGHLQRIPLHNNRALARIRTGDHTGATEDCGAVLEILGADYHPSKDVMGTTGAMGGLNGGEEGEVDLKDAWVKALKRRAEACEGRERWAEALRDWEALAGCTWAGGRVTNEALAGLGRCKKGVAAASDVASSSTSSGGGGRSISEELDILASPSSSSPNSSSSSSSSKSAPKPKPKPKPIPLSRAAAASIASAVRAAQAASQAEEDEIAAKHALKDRVDARLAAWKGGKEGNLRALLASLDSEGSGVLWPELGWTKVGMHELVTERQLKVKYTRAIAKVHPDKLNASNTTLEQRMIANGVFGTLNEAWAAHKG